jgi:hypothetical protein
MKNPLKIAVIGCGQITERVYAPILSSLTEEVGVVAVCDLDGSRASRLASARFPQARVFTEVAALLAETKPDAAMIMTSERANARTAKQIIRHGGIAVYLEKPPASTSTELADLMAAEAASNATIYTAFNRRHMPLFQGFSLSPSELRQVRGKLVRKNREVASFPFTCVHLLDSVQFFGRSTLKDVKIDFEQKAPASWTLAGTFESGASCELTFIPDGEGESEYLIFATRDETWELQFPDSDGTAPKVRLIGTKAGKEKQETSHAGDNPHEIMGFAPCLRYFLEQLRNDNLAKCGHRLGSCVRTIEILEAMQKSHDQSPAT